MAGTRLAIVNYMLSFVYIKRSNQGSFNTMTALAISIPMVYHNWFNIVYMLIWWVTIKCTNQDLCPPHHTLSLSFLEQSCLIYPFCYYVKFVHLFCVPFCHTFELSCTLSAFEAWFLSEIMPISWGHCEEYCNKSTCQWFWHSCCPH